MARRGFPPEKAQYIAILSYRSHCRSVQLAMIQSVTMKTSSTVPGQIVISVFSTKRVLKLMRFSAPMLRELASVNSLEWSNITLKLKGRGGHH